MLPRAKDDFPRQLFQFCAAQHMLKTELRRQKRKRYLGFELG